jgi:hypothetical protein
MLLRVVLGHGFLDFFVVEDLVLFGVRMNGTPRHPMKLMGFLSLGLALQRSVIVTGHVALLR